jgi:hypothetical protein
MSWMFSPREVALVSQVNVPVTGFGHSWSLADVALNIAFLLCAANLLWAALDFYGEARVACELKIEKLKLYQARKGFYSIFYNSELYVDPGIIKGGSALNSMATAELGTTFISRAGELAGTVSTDTNQLLRSLAYYIDLNMLRREVERLLHLANNSGRFVGVECTLWLRGRSIDQSPP